MKHIGEKIGLIAVMSGALWLPFTETAAAADTIVLTLEDSVQLAMEKNHSIKESRSDVDSARWKLHETKRGGGPTVSWSMTAKRLGGKAYQNADYQHEISHDLEASIPLYTSGKLENNIKAADYNLDAATLALEEEKQSVRKTVLKDYFDILKYRSQVQVYQDSVDNLQAHLDTVNAQYGVGTVAKSDVLSSEVSLANEKQNLVSSQNDYDVAVATLNNVVGLPTDTVTIIKDELSYTKYDFVLSECLDYALVHRPDLLEKQYNVEAYRAEVEAAKAASGIQVSGVAARTFAGSGIFSDNHTGSDSWSLGLSASWNVFDNQVTKAKVKQKEASWQKAQKAVQEQEDTVRLEVRTAYLDLIAAEKNIKTLQSSLDKAQEDYRIEQARYSAGVGTNLDVLDAAEKLCSAQGNYVSALYTYNVSKASLDKAMGLSVDLDAQRYHTILEQK